jgi:glycosyltransferase involved in cell wall biosynthesis
MNQPLVSVVIPVYNRAEMLREALESVFGQEYQPLQVLVVDDGSSDNWKEKIAGFNVDIIELPHCGMPGKVRNEGIKRAEGEYIAFLDSDDIWLKGKLWAQLEEMQASGSSLCHTREIWDRNGRTVSQRKQKHNRVGDVFSDALIKCMIGPSTVLMQTKIFAECGLFREDLEIAEDYELWLRVTDRYPVCYVDIPLVRKRAGSWPQLSEKYGMIEYFRIQALKSLVDEHKLTVRHSKLAGKELARKCGIYADGCINRGKQQEAGLYRGLSVKYS